MSRPHLFHRDLLRVLRRHRLFALPWVQRLVALHTAADGASPRFVRFLDRPRRWSPVHAWGIFDAATYRAGLHYKGLLNCKTPFDLSLYAHLLWELKPRTVIELGALHGGSALWFADQLAAICGGGAVHSFERHPELLSPRARHPLLTFHKADLTDLRSLKPALFRSLAHPWLIVDDAHVQVARVVRFLDRFAQVGDYYVIEDVTDDFDSAEYERLGRTLDALDYRVDTAYTDNFGLNLTCAPNGWLRKMSPRRSSPARRRHSRERKTRPTPRTRSAQRPRERRRSRRAASRSA